MRGGTRSIGRRRRCKRRRLRKHKEVQDREREEARGWQDEGYAFAKPDGEPLIPNTDYHHWKKLLSDAGVCE